MRLFFSAVLILVLPLGVFSQHTLRATILDDETREPLPGASAMVAGTTVGSTADVNGVVEIHGIASGEQIIEFSFLGYESQSVSLTFPLSSNKTIEIYLEKGHHALEEVLISSTRSSRTIADLPTRVEFIAGEELEEKANMKPGDIRMLLNESTGIQTQQTSATSANAAIRIQGLDGRYTQILKDGFPLYAGFSGGLGLLQTPPLDLRQVEVIKGATSTLYGGGAIAGLVNLISRVPTDERDLRLMLNGTSAMGLDLSGFYGERYGKTGVTVFASRNTSEAYDPADIGLTAIPKTTRYTFNPKFFADIKEGTSLYVGLNFTTEDRMGGDLEYIEGNGNDIHRFFEENQSTRYSTQLSLTHTLNKNSVLVIKNSVNHFDRLLRIPDYAFEGVQNSTFSEFHYARTGELSEWIAGLNVWTEEFSEQRPPSGGGRDYAQTTFGAFVQNTATISESVSVEAGIRGDYVIDYGFVLLPRISLLYKASPKFSSRIGGGFGYKAPTIFTEDSERIQFQGVLPISSDANMLERSYGANWDLNFRTQVGDATFSINHLFFYTYLAKPLALEAAGSNNYVLVNRSGFTDSKGTETNIKIELGDFKLFVGYTFTDTKLHDGDVVVQNPLTAKNRLNNVLMYEVEEKWKVGLEAYYFSRQRLTDNSYGQDYWICGFMVEKVWEKFSLFINFENFLDARQTRFGSIYSGSISNPLFHDIYAPMDGFVINGGVKLNL